MSLFSDALDLLLLALAVKRVPILDALDALARYLPGLHDGVVGRGLLLQWARDYEQIRPCLDCLDRRLSDCPPRFAPAMVR